SVRRRSGSNNLRLPGTSTLAGEEHLPVASTRGPPLFVALRFVQFSRNDQSLHRQKNYFLKSDYYNVSSFRFFVNTLFLFFFAASKRLY
ncbi:hypothetical protein P4519_14065, partial [Geobacillus stearothermophilus]|uniref:hypothetical protein n=6 Tax=Geobacillus stearothermophilus TaxID=1422 RepID=UPI002E1B4A27|nr:hypothetical protein [Geobacillus stearothermophilus]